MQERNNRRWAVENGAGLKQREPGHAGFWLRDWLAEGTLAAAAWSGFMRLPKFGLYQIVERVTGGLGAGPAPAARQARTRGGPRTTRTWRRRQKFLPGGDMTA